MSITNLSPDFIILGAQKAGTTALHEYLSKHPNLSATKEKEIHYFDCKNRYESGKNFYFSHFDFENDNKLTFDSSSGYLENINSAERIYKHNPNVKLIILLRNPVERAYSAWNMYKNHYLRNREWFFQEWNCFCNCENDIHLVRRRDEHLFDFHRYILDETAFDRTNKLLEASVLHHGFYFQQIQKYLNFFNISQILILENNDMRNNLINTLKKIELFLDIPSFDWSCLNLKPIFEGRYYKPMEETTKKFLYEYYKPHNSQLFQSLGKIYDWNLK